MLTSVSVSQTGEIVNLAGCDFLTIAPALLEQLTKTTEPLEQVLSPEKGAFILSLCTSPVSDHGLDSAAAKGLKEEKVTFVDNEPAFRWSLLQVRLRWTGLPK